MKEKVPLKKIIFILLLCFLISGCASIGFIGSTNNLSLGMTKAEVIKVMGQPASTKASANGVEVFEYVLCNPYRPDPNGIFKNEQYWIMLEGGKVIQYGRAGDFDTAVKADITIENKY